MNGFCRIDWPHAAQGQLLGTNRSRARSTHFDNPNPVPIMTPIVSDISATLREDLYEKTRAQLNRFLDETNALLAAGDALREDRTEQARERLAAFLEGVDVSVQPVEAPPPLTRAVGQAQGWVVSRPWAAVGAAAGVGLLLSLLLLRKPH